MSLQYLHREFIAALLALYGPHPGTPLTAAPELTKTILPPWVLFRRKGKATLVAVTREKKFTSKCFFHESRDVSSPMRHRGSSVPALRIRPSRPWKCDAPRASASDSAFSSVLSKC